MMRLATFLFAMIFAIALAEISRADYPTPQMQLSWMTQKMPGGVPDPGPCPSRIVPWLPPTPHMCAPHGIRRHPLPWISCYPGEAWTDTYDPKPITWLPPTLFGASPYDQCPTFFPAKIRHVIPALDGTEALTDGR